jgi:hypothetical protein
MTFEIKPYPEFAWSISRQCKLDECPRREIELAYEEGGTLVEYIWKRWGLERLRRFADAVTACDMTPAGIRHATRETLRGGWKELESGWKRFIPTAQ